MFPSVEIHQILLICRVAGYKSLIVSTLQFYINISPVIVNIYILMFPCYKYYKFCWIYVNIYYLLPCSRSSKYTNSVRLHQNIYILDVSLGTNTQILLIVQYLHPYVSLYKYTNSVNCKYLHPYVSLLEIHKFCWIVNIY